MLSSIPVPTSSPCAVLEALIPIAAAGTSSGERSTAPAATARPPFRPVDHAPPTAFSKYILMELGRLYVAARSPSQLVTSMMAVVVRLYAVVFFPLLRSKASKDPAIGLLGSFPAAPGPS